MIKDDWITKLYIMEKINKQKIEVPLKFGWLSPVGDNGYEYDVTWCDNVDNYTTNQCNIVADVTSRETKFVDKVMDDETFNKNFYDESPIRTS